MKMIISPGWWKIIQEINGWSDESMEAHFIQTEPLPAEDS
jgi:hypothetical protein